MMISCGFLNYQKFILLGRERYECDISGVYVLCIKTTPLFIVIKQTEDVKVHHSTRTFGPYKCALSN